MGRCRALTLDKLVMSRNNCILLRKNSPYTDSFNREYEYKVVVTERNSNQRFINFYRVLLLRQSGLAQYIEKKYLPASSVCSLRELKSREGRQMAITLIQFWGIFLILIIGYLMSFTFFFGELFIISYQKHRRQLQTPDLISTILYSVTYSLVHTRQGRLMHFFPMPWGFATNY